MRAFFAAPNTLKQNEIAARQLRRSASFVSRGTKGSGVKRMFLQIRDHA
jgi:hypothetical protein